MASLDTLFQCFISILSGVDFLKSILDISRWHLNPLLFVLSTAGMENR